MGRPQSVFTRHADKRKQKAKSATSQTKERRLLAKNLKEAEEKKIERAGRRTTKQATPVPSPPLVVDNKSLQPMLEEERRLHAIKLQRKE
jgi:hypothetical protein